MEHFERLETDFIRPPIDWTADYPDDLEVLFADGNCVLRTWMEDVCFELTLIDCSCYRLGPTNDEGWHNGQCRFSKIAPEWGGWFEVSGDLRLKQSPRDWHGVPQEDPKPRKHYLAYFKEYTFEAQAGSWRYVAGPAIKS